jgi:hypothetical protein
MSVTTTARCRDGEDLHIIWPNAPVNYTVAITSYK